MTYDKNYYSDFIYDKKYLNNNNNNNTYILYFHYKQFSEQNF